MPAPIPSGYRYHLQMKRNFGALYVALTILSFHWAIVLYMNSSYLEQFVSSATVGVLYTLASAVTILLFLSASHILRHLGNYNLTLLFGVTEFCVLVGMAMTSSLPFAIFFFMIHQIVVPLLLFNLDIYLEDMIGNEESSTGTKHGIFLLIMSLTTAIAPLASGFLIGTETPNYSLAYIAGAIFMIPFCIIIMRYFRTFSDPIYSGLRALPALRLLLAERDIRNVFFAQFLLQLFFAWMVIYTPLYLAKEVGFNWEQIGLILFVALMAYVIFEYPIGVVADRWLGEKEMMAFGILILAVSTSWMTFVTSVSIGVWMLVLFMTRVGASFLESTAESYFFKHTKSSDAEVIGFYRINRPLSYVIGAGIGSLTLWFLPFNLLFVVLGLLMIPGFFAAMALKDTK